MNKTILYTMQQLAVLAVFALTMLISCNGEEKEKNVSWLQDVEIASSYLFTPGEKVTITGKGFQSGDILIIDGSKYGIDKSFHVMDLSDITGSGASFVVSERTVSGTYDFSASRLGSGELVLASGVSVKMSTDPVEVPDVIGKNIKGYIHCDGKPMENVVVSDGFEVVTTDNRGFYYIGSVKKSGLVYISIPGNYMPEQIPGTNQMRYFWHLEKSASETERHDFELFPEKNEKHAVIVAADFHLANRTSDKSQFRQVFVPDVKAQVAANDAKDIPTYVFTLGDLTWEQFWNNGYRLNQFVADSDMRGIRSNSRSIPFFNCMGNHDNNIAVTSGNVDWDAEGEYRRLVCPVYYSFNLGKVHYIVIDNVEYLNTNGTGNANYTFVTHQLEWLKKDLATITDKSTPIVVGSHSPLHSPTGAQSNNTGNITFSERIGNYGAFMKTFEGFSDVTVLTGHMHTAFNLINPAYPNIMERNLPAVCATWWWTGNHLGKDVQICQDGAPGGFGILNVKGKDTEYHYKGYGLSLDKQFRTYDRNTIELTPDKYSSPNFSSTYTAPYHTPANNNQVIINVWNWGPGWSISVTENTSGGKVALTPTPSFMKDPYHMVTYELQRLKTSTPTSTFLTGNKPHFFVVTASAANTTLDIVVKDSYGNEYTEQMQRPKAFPVSDQEIKDYYFK